VDPTLLDVITLTNLDVTTLVNPFDLHINTTHDIPTSCTYTLGGWGGYIEIYSKILGLVSNREHIAFLIDVAGAFLLLWASLGYTPP
jgi:hypothetical protein